MTRKQGEVIRGLSFEHRVGSVVLKLTGAALILATTLALVRPSANNIQYNRALVFTVFVIALAMAVGVTRWGRNRGPAPAARGPRSLSIAALTSAGGGIAGYLLAQPVRLTYGWDAAVLSGFSRGLASGQGLSDYARDYLSRYPNNVPGLAMFNVARRIGGPSDAGMYTAYLVANGVCLAVVLFCVFVLVRRLRSTRSAFLAQAVVFVLVGCSPWMAIPYTDIPAMPPVVLSVTLAALAATSAGSWQRLGLVVGALAAAAVAFVLKSTPASLGVALGLILLLVLVAGSPPGRRRAAVALAAGTAAFATATLGSLAVADRVAGVDRSTLDTSRTAPVQWWLANGLTTSAPGTSYASYGGYSGAMVKESKWLRGEALATWSTQRLRSQAAKMGVEGIVAFELRKLPYNWGDGMFFAWWATDGQPSRLTEHGSTARAVQQWQHPDGSGYPLRAALTNGLWLALLGWAGSGLLRETYRRSLLVVAVPVLGIGMFIQLFQGGSRYLLAFVPVIVALSAVVDPLKARRADLGATADPVCRSVQ